MQRQFLLLLISVLFLGGCKKDEDPAPPAPPSPPPVETEEEHMFRLRFTFKKGTSLYTFSNYINDAQGRPAQFDKVRFFVSNIRIVNNDGSLIKAFPGVVLNVDASNISTYAHEVGLKVYGVAPRLLFDIGLDEPTNAMQPNDFSFPPLNDQTLYQSGSGYKFTEFTGRWDSNNNGSVTSSDQAASFICLGQSMVRMVDLYLNTHSFQPTIGVQMSNILNGINCSSNAISIGASAVNSQFMNNLQAGIHYQ